MLGCEWCLDQNNRQGLYGESFIRALAGAAGLSVARQDPDCTGIDFWISSTREVRDDVPLVAVQVKSWSVPSSGDGFWRFRGLTEKRFNALVGARRVPRFLFVVTVPPCIEDYACADDNLLKLSHAAYWVSLRDFEKIREPSCDRKVRVMIPQENLLNVDSLTKLCEES